MPVQRAPAKRETKPILRNKTNRQVQGKVVYEEHTASFLPIWNNMNAVLSKLNVNSYVGSHPH